MSHTMVRIEPRDQFKAREFGNSKGEDLPVDDTTELTISLGDGDDCPYMSVSVGKWRELVAVVESGIAVIPAERGRRREREAAYRARQAVVAAAEAVRGAPVEAVQS